MGAVDTARGRLRLSPATAMAATGVAVTDTARGRLRPSPATAMAVMAADMVVTAAIVATVTARGRLSLVTAMAAAMVVTAAMVATVMAVATATGVSYHRRRRSEMSQKQNRTKIVIVEAVKT